MDKTGIIWTEKTWNPMSGCQKVSSGCKFCYAETIAKNYSGTAFPNGFDLTYRPHKLKEPYRWKEPTLCFANSMSDFFWEKVSDEYRDQMLQVIIENPQHEFQVLTKRPHIMKQYFSTRKVPSNFWAGVTVEDAKAMHRIDILKEIDAEIRFVSAEPLIGPLPGLDLSDIQWIITGGESGNHLWKEKHALSRGLVVYDRSIKRWMVKPEAAQWIRDIRDEAFRAGTKFFHKQWGGNYPEAAGRTLDGMTYNEFPRLPGNKKTVANDYLAKLEAENRQSLFV
jgi:protein gp37